jgi:hypothetical protein
MADSVQLTDLDVITRYSIAVRTASADRDELIETLRADLTWLERGQRRTAPAPVVEVEPVAVAEDDEPVEPPRASPPLRRMPAKVRATPARKAAAKKAPAKKAAAKKVAAKKVAAKKAAPRRSSR